MHADDDSVFSALRAGARGYLVKGSAPHHIVSAVRAIAEGQVVFDAALAQRVLAELRTPRTPDDAFPQLTSREQQVFALLADGLNNRVIAQRLGVSAKTVANHVSNVFAKLHLADRAEAIIRARDAGLGTT
jgi:DNA-binding NarL/FixJ family response regulator